MEDREGKAHLAWPGLLGLMLARLLLLVGLLVLFSLILPSDSVAFYAFMALTYIVSIPHALWLRSRERVARLVPLQFVVDLVVVTGVVYFTGGLRSDLSLLYPLVILSAGLLTTPRHAVQITVLSMLVYVTLIALLAQGVLLPYGPPVDYLNQSAVLKSLFLRIAVFACFGLASAYVSQRCQYSDRKLSRFREMAVVIFRNVRAGLMLLDAEGIIRMVNERACAMLGKNERDLLGLSAEKLAVRGAIVLGHGESKDALPCFFGRADGTAFPVSYETSQLALPGEAVPGLGGPESVQVTILVFSDISRLVDMQEKVELSERVRSAVETAARIAHEIRNPLAAVSGAVQLLQQVDEKIAAAGEGGGAKALREERRRIFGVVVTEAARLDRTIEQFVNYAEFSPEAISMRLKDSVRPTDALTSRVAGEDD